MASLRDLKNRLRSVKTTGKLAGAMRTVAAAKYAKVSSRMTAGGPYAKACAELYRLAENAAADEKNVKRHEKKREEALTADTAGKPLYVLVSGNRGLCGGYNHELFAFFNENVVSRGEEYELVACGRMAREYCAEKGIKTLKEFDVSDVPAYEEAKALLDYIEGRYASGEASSVSFVCQHFHNMLKQTPEIRRFLPPCDAEEDAPQNAEGSREVLFVPDAETVKRELRSFCLTAELESLLLSCASGAQAATLMAMRAAYDNASGQVSALETQINRRRQAEVTQSVIETAADYSDR